MAAAASWRFDAIGTGWEILTERPLEREVRDAVTARIDAFDRTWSRFRVDSAVSALARGGGSIPVPSDAVPMLASTDGGKPGAPAATAPATPAAPAPPPAPSASIAPVPLAPPPGAAAAQNG